MPKKLDRAAACRSWGAYVRCVGDLLWLRDWTLSISPETCDEDAYASVECVPGRRRAIIYFSDAFLGELGEDQQRQVVVHELLHAHFDACAQMAQRGLGDRYEDFLMMFEHGIDATADAFAEHLPLPSEVKAKGKRG